jgi:hypothetical protein
MLPVSGGNIPDFEAQQVPEDFSSDKKRYFGRLQLTT